LSERKHYQIVIIGGGILGCSIAYLLSYNLRPGTRILLVEQEISPAFHASSRNTGKVHAPFLYDPSKRKMFARSASIGFDMLSDYCQTRHLPFIKDGILEVATDEVGLASLDRYLGWGYSNGLNQEELRFLDKREVAALEPNVRCVGALHCTKDASVNFGEITASLLTDAQNLGCETMLGSKVITIVSKDNTYQSVPGIDSHSHDKLEQEEYKFQLRVQRMQRVKKRNSASSSSSPTETGEELLSGDKISDAGSRKSSMKGVFKLQVEKLSADYLINVAGGAALRLAHNMGLAKGFQSLYFRGEYWVAPHAYKDLTKMSIYSVPRYPEYPFLDPHWIVRVDGRREVGPNAVLVNGPFAYDWNQNMSLAIPKFLESIRDTGRAGLFRLFTDRRFIRLAISELRSSISKKVMINRARKFLPALDPSLFTLRGTSGIRSSIVDRDGKFVSDIFIVGNEDSTHVLNYNSPGATGALPVAAMIVDKVLKSDVWRSAHPLSDKLSSKRDLDPASKWDIHQISNLMTTQS
jgi:(S)-2-hydroxyglutarate dehydrogenase